MSPHSVWAPSPSQLHPAKKPLRHRRVRTFLCPHLNLKPMAFFQTLQGVTITDCALSGSHSALTKETRGQGGKWDRNAPWLGAVSIRRKGILS